MHFEDSDVKSAFENFKSMKLTIEKERSEEMPCTELFKEDRCGKQIFDEAFIAEMHSRLSHLCSDKWV